MPWCPKCKFEYRDGFTKCSDCEVELVENLEVIKEEPEDTSNVLINEILLATVSNVIELSYITSMLEADKIKYRVATKNDVVFKKMFLGDNSDKKIYVEESDVDKAIQIIQSLESQSFVD